MKLRLSSTNYNAEQEIRTNTFEGPSFGRAMYIKLHLILMIPYNVGYERLGPLTNGCKL